MKASKVFCMVMGMLALMLILCVSCSGNIGCMDKSGVKSILKVDGNTAELGELGWVKAIHYDVGLRVFDLKKRGNSIEGKIENVRDETIYGVEIWVDYQDTPCINHSAQRNLYPGEVTEWLVHFDDLTECEQSSLFIIVDWSDKEESPFSTSPTTFVGQCCYLEGTPEFIAVQNMCWAITDASNGNLVMQLYEAGTVVPPRIEIDGVQEGVLDFAVTRPAYWQEMSPAARLFSTRSGGLSALDKHSWFVCDGGYRLVQQMIEGGGYDDVQVVPGPGLLLPAEIFMHSTEAITYLDDLKGLKMRHTEDAGEILNRLGVSAIPLLEDETYEAIIRGVIDACEMGDACYNWGMGMHQVARYVYTSESRVPHNFSPLVINRESWDELPTHLKNIIIEEGMAATLDCYDQAITDNAECLQNYVDFGCYVEELPSRVTDTFIAKAAKFYDEQAVGDPFYTEVLQSLRDFTSKTETKSQTSDIEEYSQNDDESELINVDGIARKYNLRVIEIYLDSLLQKYPIQFNTNHSPYYDFDFGFIYENKEYNYSNAIEIYGAVKSLEHIAELLNNSTLNKVNALSTIWELKTAMSSIDTQHINMLLEKQEALQLAKINRNLSYSKEQTTAIIENTYDDYFKILSKLRESLPSVLSELQELSD